MMVSDESLEVMAEKLRVYDVVQRGWEQEPNGFEANMRHVVDHLIDTMDRKDFDDREIVMSDIAPDALQYGLRLGRWTDQEPGSLRLKDEEIHEVLTTDQALGNGCSFVAMNKAIVTLSRNSHDLAHTSTQAEALNNRNDIARRAAGLLIYCADQQSISFDFSLERVFDDRLASLRVRFDIPDPE